MSQIIAILAYEEGYKEAPYIDSEGYPTVACGIRIGPQHSALSNYTFTVPQEVGDVWTQQVLARQRNEMLARPAINAALQQCNDARRDVLDSMAYQLGVTGLAAFILALTRIANRDFENGAKGLADSLWARQAPQRARRHAEVMSSGTYDAYKGLL